MSDHKLILYPKDPHAPTVERQQIEKPLREAGFIGSEIETVGETRFKPGPRFVALMPFSGPSDPKHCTIQLSEPAPEIEFLGGGNVEAPDCPSCGFSMQEWAGEISKWYDEREKFESVCPGCGAKAKLWHLDWHRTNAFGRYTIDVWNVELGDAAPSAKLLQVLRETNESEWDFFYYIL